MAHKSKLVLMAAIAFALNAPTALSQTLPLEAGSWGGKVRSGPSMEHDQIGSLREGDVVTLIERSSSDMNGYPWFKIGYGDNHIGYQWGGILCGIETPVDGVFLTCTAPLIRTEHSDTTDDKQTAQPNHVKSVAEQIDACVKAEKDQTRDGSACIGMIADPCLNQDGIFATPDLRQCIADEHKIWDDRLNANYQALMASLDESVQKTALRDMQRLWIKFSQEFCGLEYKFYEGTMYLVTGDYCLLEMTAKQSIAIDGLSHGSVLGEP